jgi:hypothetical protein
MTSNPRNLFAGRLIKVGPITTTDAKRKMVRVESREVLPQDRPLCTCEYCRKLGIENQTTLEYRQAKGIRAGSHVHQ